jgi:hypothetical protein
MNLQNYRLEPNPNSIGDWIVFGDICDDAGNILGTFGENGTSVFGWWVTQDVVFQMNYSNQFAVVMAQEIVAGTAE